MLRKQDSDRFGKISFINHLKRIATTRTIASRRNSPRPFKIPDFLPRAEDYLPMMRIINDCFILEALRMYPRERPSPLSKPP